MKKIFIKFINMVTTLICERKKYNDLITSLSLYPIKYLNELYFIYILLTSISLILNISLFLLQNSLFLILLLKLILLRSFLYIVKKKSKIFFIIIMGIHAVIIYFALYLSICIRVFVRIVCIMIFTQIVSFKIISMKRSIFRFVSMLFQIFKKCISKKLSLVFSDL